MLNLPLNHINFFKDYFEQKPLHCAMEDKPMDLHDIDAFLNTREPDERRLQSFFKSKLRHHSHKTTKKLNIN